MSDFRIQYILTIPKQNLEDASAFFGFTPGVIECLERAQRLLFLPAHIYQFVVNPEIEIAMKMSGGTYKIQPVEVDVLPELPITSDTPFWCILSTPETQTQVAAFVGSSDHPVLHVSITGGPNSVSYEDLSAALILKYCHRVVAYFRKQGATRPLESLNSLPLEPAPRSDIPITLEKRCHFLTYANEILLESNRYVFSGTNKMNVGSSNAPYLKAIVDSANQIENERNRIEAQCGLKWPPPITAILTCPGFYQHLYKMELPPKTESALLRKLISTYRRQGAYFLKGDALEIADFQTPEAQAFIQWYRMDIAAYSHAVAIKAANHFVPVYRLPPATNLVYPDLDLLGKFIRQRAPNPQHAQRKRERLFGNIQRKLESAVPVEITEAIDRKFARIKLIANAPLEWLPVRGLPLMLRHELSRIPTTPGNVMSMQTVMSREMAVPSAAFEEILIIRSYETRDPVRGFLSSAIDAIRGTLSTTRVRVADVRSAEEFQTVANEFTGMVMIFDGHGQGSQNGIGSVSLNGQAVDLYKLRTKMQVPPIVILSSCDTHAIDGSHASVANTFLMLGAVTVLGTLLPINAIDASMFISRLIVRIDEYIPMITKNLRRAVRWSSVISEMQQMVYVTEQLFAVFATRKQPDFQKQYLNVQSGANRLIMNHDPEWYEKTIALIAHELKTDEASTWQIVKSHQLVDVIKYIQLGNPEQILITESLD